MSCPGATLVSSIVACLILTPDVPHAAWPADPLVNVRLCDAAGDQRSPALVSDGHGGAIAVWQDYRASSYFDVFAQRVLLDGVVDPAWPVNGLDVRSPAGSLDRISIVSDGNGGAIVAWSGYPAGTWNVAAQHLTSAGSIDPTWPANGRSVTTSWIGQERPALVSDGAGGAIAVWQEYNRSGAFADIYAQHVLANGVIDPAWPANGLAISVHDQPKRNPVIATDGAGGAIVVWEDFQSGTSRLFAHHLVGVGVVDPAWPINGTVLTNSVHSQTSAAIVSDGSGSAIVVWVDSRIAGSNDIYAQRIHSTSGVDPAWPAGGLLVCGALNHQATPAIATDGSGGAIVTWADARSGTNNDIYAQHVISGGMVDPEWPPDGRALSLAQNSQEFPAVAPDGSGGGMVVWQDYRAAGSSGSDIYAMHVRSDGTVDDGWPSHGQAVSTATGSQYAPAILTGPSGDAIIVWQDGRSGAGLDIYAQAIQVSGLLGTPVAEVPRLALPRFALESVQPNPTTGVSLRIQFSLRSDGPVTLELFDISGRRAAVHSVETLGPGQHTLELQPDDRLPAGVYLLRLRHGPHARTARVAVIP